MYPEDEDHFDNMVSDVLKQIDDLECKNQDLRDEVADLQKRLDAIESDSQDRDTLS